MKRLLLIITIILLIPSGLFAQDGLVSVKQLAGTRINVTAGEDLTTNDVVSLINESGAIKAYKNDLIANTSPNGAESVFNAATSTYISCVQLDSTRFLVAFVDSDTYPKAIVGTVTGSTIAWGSEVTVNADAATWVNVCKVDTDKCLISFIVGSSPNGYSEVLTISGNVISKDYSGNYWDSYGTPAISYISTCQIDTNKILICYYNTYSSNQGLCRIITISGTNFSVAPTSGSVGTIFNADATAYISVSALSSTSAIVAYQDGGDSNKGYAQVLSISGTTITPGTEYKFRDAAVYYIGSCGLSSTLGVIVYGDGTYGNALTATNSSGALSFGTAATWTYGQFNSVCKISETSFALASNVSDVGKNRTGSISGTTITFGTEQTFNSGASNYINIVYLGSQKSVVTYQDGGNSSYGSAIINTWTTSSYTSVKGVCTSTTSSGSSAPILLKGRATGFSNLIAGSPYFLQSDYSIGTTPVALASTMYTNSATTREVCIGTAMSTTEIYIDVDYK